MLHRDLPPFEPYPDNGQDSSTALPAQCTAAKAKSTTPSIETRHEEQKIRQSTEYNNIVVAFKENYIEKSRGNHYYKKVFFWTVTSILFAIVGGFVLLCLVLLLTQARWELTLPFMDGYTVVIDAENNIGAILSVAGGGAATVIVALLKLPKIIAEHLFPLNEDRDMADIIRATK
ncbi:MAG: hypothetical protein FWE40_04420 [Oscillospiraceae bacterium]|nr:hypothetical protein [Oscillospiraceae bacterium]